MGLTDRSFGKVDQSLLANIFETIINASFESILLLVMMSEAELQCLPFFTAVVYTN